MQNNRDISNDWLFVLIYFMGKKVFFFFKAMLNAMYRMLRNSDLHPHTAMDLMKIIFIMRIIMLNYFLCCLVAQLCLTLLRPHGL